MLGATIDMPPLPLLPLGREDAAWLAPDDGCLRGSLKKDLAPLVEEARGAVGPFVEAVLCSVAEARVCAEGHLEAFLAARRRVWALLVRHIARHPLELFRHLRGSVRSLQRERIHWRVDADVHAQAERDALWQLRAAASTYDLTVRLAVQELIPWVEALAGGRVAAELEAFERGLPEFLARLDRASGRFEFGVIAVRALQDRGEPLAGHRFVVACELASRGADEQHVLVRSAIRAVLPEGDAPCEDGGAAPSGELSGALFSDWVRGVLAS